MMRSLYSGVAGLKTHQTKMDVIGNNIANVNTTAYKSQSITFNELMYQTTKRASGASAETGIGGTNAGQIGLGVKVGAINTNITSQGAMQTTNLPFDIAITGDSFFIVSNGFENFFTRAGSFYVDGAGNLAMTSTGYNVMGWQVDPENPNNIRKDTVSALRVMTEANMTYEAEATSRATVSGIVDRNDTDINSSAGKVMNLEFFDNLGFRYTARFSTHVIDADAGNFYIKLDSIRDSNGNPIDDARFNLVNFGSDIILEGLNERRGRIDGVSLTNLVTFSTATTDPQTVGQTYNIHPTTGTDGALSRAQLLAIFGDAAATTPVVGGIPAFDPATDTVSYTIGIDGQLSLTVNGTTTTHSTRVAGVDITSGITMANNEANITVTVPAPYTVAGLTPAERTAFETLYGINFTALGILNFTIGADGFMTVTRKEVAKAATLNYDSGNGRFSDIAGQTTGLLNLSFIQTNPAVDMSNFGNIELDFNNTLMNNNAGMSTLGASAGGTGEFRGMGAGRRLGEMIEISVQDDGRIFASYDNGMRRLLAQIATATFANPSGLEKKGDNLYSATMNSGDFDGIGEDIKVGGGYMTSGVLEMSNVDLSSEFTEMITTQRGFQANSRIITVSDSLLEELTNLKR